MEATPQEGVCFHFCCSNNAKALIVALQLKKLVLDIGSLADGYKTAGQSLQIKVGDSKPGFFAIASAPDSNNQGLVEVLIKDGPPESAANLLCNMSTGMIAGNAVWQMPVCVSMQAPCHLTLCFKNKGSAS